MIYTVHPHANKMVVTAHAAIKEPALDDLCHTELHRFS